MDGIVGGVPASGPSGWQGGEVFSEVQRWNRIEAVSQMKTPSRDKRALKIVLDACDIISAERTFRIRPQRPAKPNEHDESRAGVQFALPLAVVFLGWSTCCKRGAPSEWQPCEAQISKEQKAGRAAEVTPSLKPTTGPSWNDTTTTRSAECVVVLPFAKILKVVYFKLRTAYRVVL